MNMHRASLLHLIAVAAAFIPASAHAGYVNDKRSWLALSPEHKAGYVQGLNDSINYIFSDDSLPTALAKRGRQKCLAAQRTTAAVLADRITTAYNTDQRMSGVAPTAVYIIRMQDVCRSYINEERAQFGLPPI